MQETNGYFERRPLDAVDDGEARRLGWLWHGEHHGQTVITRRGDDGPDSIVTIIGG
jgi:hypothetical protein